MYQTIYHSPLGPIHLESDGTYLTRLRFETPTNMNAQKELSIFQETIHWLDLYFKGQIPDFIPNYKIEGTHYQKQVLKIISNIPYGTTITYSEIGKRLLENSPQMKISYQAIGAATGKNPICLIIPCHRVIGKDGKLHGYNGGIEIKQKLLEMEKKYETM